MNRNTRRIAMFTMVGMVTFASHSIITEAAEMPIAGIDIVLNEFYQNKLSESETISDYLEPSEYKDLAIAQVTNYVNIRSKAKEKSKIVGKLYNNAAATILKTDGDWLKIKSGTVTGYINADYLIVGEKVEKLAKSVGQRIATVTTETLYVREKASTDASIQTLVPIGEELNVKKELDGWVKVTIDDDIVGYVSSDYVELRTEYEQAESIKEEKARLAAEEAVKRAAEEERRIETASQGIASATYSQQSDKTSNTSNTSNTSTTSTTSSIRSQIVEYALRFNGNPYVWGGTSLTNGADCSGYVQSVFRDKGISIPRNSRSQAGGGREISINNIQPGDLVFYTRNGTINHVALYIGNGKVINASSPATGIRITNYNYREPYKAVSYID